MGLLIRVLGRRGDDLQRGGDGRITAWETASNAPAPQPIRKIEAHQGWIRALSVSPDGSLLASGGNDRMVRIWETATGKLVRELAGHTGHVYSLGFHPDGKTILSGDLLGAIKQWDLATGNLAGAFDAKPLHTYEGGQQVDFGGIRGLAITPDGKLVAAGGLHKATNPLGAIHEPIAILFEGESRKNVRTLLADGIPQGGIWRLHFLADGSLLGACGGATAACSSSGKPTLTRITTGSACPTSSGTWTFIPTACGSPRPTTTATSASPASPPKRPEPVACHRGP